MAVIRCPTCGARLELDDQYLGQEVDCGDCRATFVARAEDDRPPRDYEDEDADDDRPRRRRSRGSYKRSARDRLQSPGTWLQVVGWLGIVGGVLNLGMAVIVPLIILNIPPPPGGAGPQGNPKEEAIINAIGSAVGGVFALVIGVVIVMGATRMKRLESYGFAMTATILAMIPCFSPCCLIGLPFGIIALKALNDPDVREAFDDYPVSD